MLIFKLWAFFGLSFKNFLYILDTKPLSDIWFANIFSHSVGCLSTFLIMSFDAQKFKIFMKSLAHFLIEFVSLLLSFKSSLYILDNSPLPNLSFANIFSHSVACLISLTLSFVEQKFLILMKSSLFLFLSWIMSFGCI